MVLGVFFAFLPAQPAAMTTTNKIRKALSQSFFIFFLLSSEYSKKQTPLYQSPDVPPPSFPLNTPDDSELNIQQLKILVHVFDVALE
jgi:hypothetical protein